MKYYTTNELCEMFQCGKSKIYQLCREGSLNYIDLNCGQKKHIDYRFSQDDVNDFISKCEEKAKASLAAGSKPRYVKLV